MDENKIIRTIIREKILNIPKAATYSYTNSYFWWKKIHNIVILFRDEIKNYADELSVLDVGCGNGFNLFYLNSFFGKNIEIEFLGIDISHTCIYFANERKKMMAVKNLKFGIGNAEALNLKDESFDIVLCTEVLEHLSSPERCVAELFRVVKAGGSVIITTPNAKHILARLGKKVKSYKPRNAAENIVTEEYTYSDLIGNHISVKSLGEWEDIFKKYGFIIEKRKRGGLLFGGRNFDKHRLAFAFILVVEEVLDRIPFWPNLSEDIIVLLKKLQ